MTYKEGKIINLIQYFIVNSSDAVRDKLHLLKLMYLADRYHMRKYGQMITTGEYKAYPKGPVNDLAYSMLYKMDVPQSDGSQCYHDYIIAYDVNGHHKYSSVQARPTYPYLSDTDLEAAKVAVDKLADLTAKNWSLSEFTHLFPEWYKVKDMIDERSHFYPRINLLDFFLDPEDSSVEYCSDVSPELVRVNKELFYEGC